MHGITRIAIGAPPPVAVDLLLPTLSSYEEYNRFVVLDLHKHFDLHVLLMQNDGFVVSPDAWHDEFLNYDYIGAPWYLGANRSHGIVGNGGFSLRSKRFCETSAEVGREMLAKNPAYRFAPEDQLLCGGPEWEKETYDKEFHRQMLARGIRFAPVEVAATFAWEEHAHDPEYRGQYGFHGKHTMVTLRRIGVI